MNLEFNKLAAIIILSLVAFTLLVFALFPKLDDATNNDEVISSTTYAVEQAPVRD